MDIPAWSRWLGVGVGVLMVPTLYWVFRSLGSNVSETVLTKPSQSLVTWGPYRWVRHPLYSGACVALAALSLVAANWFLAAAVLAAVALLPALVKKEEGHLLERFAPAYQQYMRATGRFIPRFRTGVPAVNSQAGGPTNGANGG